MSEYNETNLRLYRALHCKRKFLNNWRNQLNEQKLLLDKEKTRLAGIEEFLKNSQTLQEKIQSYNKEYMSEAHRCLKRAMDLEGTLREMSHNKKHIISQPYLHNMQDNGPKEFIYAKNMEHSKRFKKTNTKV